LSRNFELLSEAGRFHEVVQSVAQSVAQSALKEPQVATPVSFQRESVPCKPILEMDGSVKHEISKLVQNLFLSAQAPRRVVFSGTEAGSGCSWMTASIADTLASQGRGSVCVVDCNFRSPGLHEQFGAENLKGLSAALQEWGPVRDYARQLSRNLWLLSCGSASGTDSAMLGSDRMRSRLEDLRVAFDYVLIDAGPMNSGHDGIVLGGLSDGVVLVLKANSSRREVARKAVQELQTAHVRVLGAVLNQRTFPIPERIYKRL
jgi:capsular exopolysaccharide synthesis family protein